MWVIHNKNLFLAIAGIVVGASIACVATFGFTLGIDFTGGTLVEVRYESVEARPDASTLSLSLSDAGFSNALLQPSGETSYIVRTRAFDEALVEQERQAIFSALSLGDTLTVSEERFTSVGPTIGRELGRKAFVAIGIVVVLIILFVAWAFRAQNTTSGGQQRKKEKPIISSWTFGFAAVITLLHDVLVPIGVFAILGAVLGVEIDALFITALLAILGYSVNDTIVVFDRVRENLARNPGGDIHEIVGSSISQTLTRSINTSLTTALVLTALLIFGSESVRWFSFTLLVGVVAGTYSSLCLASPLLVWITERKKKET